MILQDLSLQRQKKREREKRKSTGSKTIKFNDPKRKKVKEEEKKNDAKENTRSNRVRKITKCKKKNFCFRSCFDVTVVLCLGLACFA